MEKSTKQIEKNVSASFAYVKKDMLMLNDAFSDIHDKMQHLSLNHAMLLEEIGKLRAEMAKMTEKKPVAKKAPAKKKSVTKKSVVKKDDLTKVEGIGPVIRDLLYKNNILTFKKLANSSSKDLKKILDKAGPRFQMHDPSTWVKQSKLADANKWSELEKLQETLNKRTPSAAVKKKAPAGKAIKKVVKETVTYS